MRVTLTESGDEFADRARELLEARVEHNLLATVLDSTRHGSGAQTALFGLVEDSRGRLVAAALRTPPRRLVASVMDIAAAQELMEAWLTADPGLPGVGAPRAVAHALARAWEQRTGGRATLAMTQAVHTLERVSARTRPAKVPSASLVATSASCLIGWMQAFMVEAHIFRVDAAPIVDRRLERAALHVWEDDRPVAVVGTSPAVARVVRIGPAYTPPRHRCRCYASSAVAAVSHAALAARASACMLHTDLANPTSNRIYAATGASQSGRSSTTRDLRATRGGGRAPRPWLAAWFRGRLPQRSSCSTFAAATATSWRWTDSPSP